MGHNCHFFQIVVWSLCCFSFFTSSAKLSSLCTLLCKRLQKYWYIVKVDKQCYTAQPYNNVCAIHSFPVIVLLQAACHEVSSGIWVLFNSRSAFGSYLVCHHIVFLLIWWPFSNYFWFWSGCTKSASTVTRAALHFGKYHRIFNSCSCFLSFFLILLQNLLALFFFFFF